MTIRILKFWPVFSPDGVDEDNKPKLRQTDMVAYCPVGKANMQTCIEAVSRLGKLIPIDQAGDNPAVLMAHARWNVIKPAYDAWKKGHELPDKGTPIAAWAGVSQEQADALRMMGIRAVEEIAEASDSIIAKFPFPKARDLRTAAQMYLASANQTHTATKLASQEHEIESLKDQLEEMRLLVLEMQSGKPAEAQEVEEPPRRRGRPPTSKEAAAA